MLGAACGIANIDPRALAAERHDRAPAHMSHGAAELVSQSSWEYLNRATECERLAVMAANAEVRETLLYLAKRWRDFASEAVAAAGNISEHRPDDRSAPE